MNKKHRYAVGYKFVDMYGVAEVLALRNAIHPQALPQYKIREGNGAVTYADEAYINEKQALEFGVTVIAEAPKSENKDTSDTLNVQVGGDHYKSMTIQPVEFIERNRLGFCAGNVVKYVCRFKSKNGKEDLLKARHYLDLLIELEYPEDNFENVK